MIDLVLATIIPADENLTMPSAAEIEFDSYTSRHQIESLVQSYLQLLNKISNDIYELNFICLDFEQRIKIIENSKLKNIRIFSEFLTHCFRAYYSDPTVLKKINSGSVPPFPIGNFLEVDDWSILEPVYERSYVVRKH